MQILVGEIMATLKGFCEQPSEELLENSYVEFARGKGNVFNSES